MLQLQHVQPAEVIVQSGLFPPIMLRVMKHRDPLLCKAGKFGNKLKNLETDKDEPNINHEPNMNGIFMTAGWTIFR